jgi:hypothetical protein
MDRKREEIREQAIIKIDLHRALKKEIYRSLNSLRRSQ